MDVVNYPDEYWAPLRMVHAKEGRGELGVEEIDPLSHQFNSYTVVRDGSPQPPGGCKIRRIRGGSLPTDIVGGLYPARIVSSRFVECAQRWRLTGFRVEPISIAPGRKSLPELRVDLNSYGLLVPTATFPMSKWRPKDIVRERQGRYDLVNLPIRATDWDGSDIATSPGTGWIALAPRAVEMIEKEKLVGADIESYDSVWEDQLRNRIDWNA